MKLSIPRSLLAAVKAEAEAAYPRECCGLLVGLDTPQGTRITASHPSANLAEGSGRDRFEVDPQLRFDLMRALEGGPERIVGHYHSHPDGPPAPSVTDLAMAWEPEFFWLITAVAGTRAGAVTAHRIDPATGRFAEIALVIEDGPGRPGPHGNPLPRSKGLD